ncbi:MAG: Gfo/Idh/MocA family oxidoreductase [Candidatus Solibacter sp.]|jgi:predicted dehydrogenase
MSFAVGILGAGVMGEAHAKAYSQAGVRIQGIADLNFEQAKSLAARYGAEPYANTEDLLRTDPTAISICTPHGFHADSIVGAARRGIHVLVEKPHCVTIEQARAIRRACTESGVRLMVGFTQRFFPSMRELRRRIQDGVFGDLVLAVDYLVACAIKAPRPLWYLDREVAGGGIVMIGCIHAIDRLRWIAASDIVSVSAVARQVGADGDVEDLASLTLRFESGLCAMLVGYRSPVPAHARRHTFELYGTLAEAAADLNNVDRQTLEITTGSHRLTREFPEEDPFVAEIKEFVSAIESGRDPEPGLREAEAALAVVLASYESAHSGAPVAPARILTSSIQGKAKHDKG